MVASCSSQLWPDFALSLFSAWTQVIETTGGVQIIGRNSRFMGYFVTKTKKSTEKKYQKIQG